MTALYDNLGFNIEMLLDLQFREGIGVITQDVAKPHHPVDLVNTPTWATLDSGLGVLTFNGTTEYAESDTVPTADLDFTTGDYSLACWLNWSVQENSQIVMGRYELSVSGWELYLFDPTNLLTLRHHHAGGVATRSAQYSAGWTQSAWHHMVVTRTGGTIAFYRNGALLTSVGNPVEDPETSAQDLVIGARYSKNANFFNGSMQGVRVWNRLLTADEARLLYDRERRWFA